MNHIDIKYELQTEHDQEEMLVEESTKQAKAAQSTIQRACIRGLAAYEKARVDPAFIAIAGPIIKLAVGLACAADKNTDADEILADLYLAWSDGATTFDATKGTRAAWTQSVFSNKIKQMRSNLCLTGQGTAELDKPIGMDGDATGMDMLVAVAEGQQEPTKTLPDLALSKFASMALDGLTCTEIANATGEHPRKVQRAVKNDIERIVKRRVEELKFAGMTVEQIDQQINGTLTAGTGEIAPAPYYQPVFGGQQKQVKAAAAKTSKPTLSFISTDCISYISPQAGLFDFELEEV